MPSPIVEQARREHPGFPWLDVERPDTVERYLQASGWLEPGERFRGCERAGEGNMNLTLRVRTDRRRFVLKQARPWVEKYDDIPAPWDRSLSEQRFYQRVASLRDVSAAMPQLLGVDREARVLLLEDLPAASDLTDLYAGGTSIEESERDALVAYLRALHAGTRRADAADRASLANREMRSLNHQHIFVVPLDPGNGLDLDTHEAGLDGAARALARDARYVERVEALGQRYLADGPSLVHGDFFPGSWLRSDVGLRVIDPEFAFFGDPEFDVGVALAHLALADRGAAEARGWMDAYAKERDAVPLDPELVTGFAAVETMRRLIGVAQLPIPPSDGRRAALLERSRAAMLESDFGRLFEDGR